MCELSYILDAYGLDEVKLQWRSDEEPVILSETAFNSRNSRVDDVIYGSCEWKTFQGRFRIQYKQEISSKKDIRRSESRHV